MPMTHISIVGSFRAVKPGANHEIYGGPSFFLCRVGVGVGVRNVLACDAPLQ